MEAISPTAGHAWSDALLVRMAVEGKTFQQARKEVEAAQEMDVASHSQPLPQRQASIETFLRVDVQQIHAELRTENLAFVHDRTSISMEVRASAPRPVPQQPQDPLLLDLDDNGPDTTGREGARVFDLSGNGQAVLTSFATGRDALLALDRNGNGRIDDGRELFGDQHGATDGFEELRRFDGNADSAIDAKDPVFRDLQLLHGNGVLTPLAASGIQTIALSAVRQATPQATGDVVWARSHASTTDAHRVDVYAMGLQTFDQWG